MPGAGYLPSLRIIVWIGRKGRMRLRLPPEGQRMDVDVRSGDIGGRERAADLNDVPTRLWPGKRQTARENARTGCTPDFIGVKAG